MTFCASLLLLSACAQKVRDFKVSPGFDDEPSTTRRTTDEAPARSTSASRSSSSVPALPPRIIDIPTAFQEKFSDQNDGYDLSRVYNTPQGEVRFLKVIKAVKSHRHAKTSHAYYVVSGQGQAILDGITTDIRAGQMIIVPPRVTHSIVNGGGQPMFLTEFSTPEVKSSDTEWLQ